MVDVVSAEKRSAMMSNIRSKNTRPEVCVRQHLHSLGYRYRLGTKIFGFRPDIVLSKYQTAFFIHGCFWHRHGGCKIASTPKSRKDFWQDKFKKNIERDRRNKQCLADHGWGQIVVWECSVRDKSFLDFNFISAIDNGGFHEVG